MKSHIPNPKTQISTTKIAKRSKRAKNSWKVVSFAVLSGALVFASFAVPAVAQQLLDRVVARVGTSAITQTDVEAAVAFGVVEQNDADGRDAVEQLIDRRLILAEVSRFPPPEPSEAEVMALMATMRTTAGVGAAAVMKRTGVDDQRLAELARDTLRIRSYIQQRFGSGARGEQQLARWLSDIRARGDVTEINSRP